MKHKCLAAIVVFFAFFTISICLWIFQIKFTIRPNFIISALDKSGFYGKLSSYADNFKQAEGQDIAELVSIKSYIKAVDPAWLKATINKDLPIVFDYISGKTDKFSVNIDLKEYKENLPKSFLTETKLTIEGLKPCPENYTPPPDKFPDCLPQQVDPSVASGIISTNDFDEIVVGIPDVYIFDSSKKQVQDFRTFYALLNTILLICLVLSSILLIIIVLMGLSYWPSIPRWVGMTLMIPSGVLLGLDLVLRVSQSIILSLLSEDKTSTLFNSIKPLTSVFNQYFLNPSMIIAGVVFFFGLILLILSYAIPHPQEPKPAPKPSPETSTVNK